MTTMLNTNPVSRTHPMLSDSDKKNILRVKEIIKEKIISEWFMKLTINNWVLRKMFISGGCFASLLRYEEPNDFDVYTKDISAWEQMKAFLLENKDHILDIDEKYSDFYGQDGKMITANAITLKNKFQFIHKIYGEPNFVRQSFDFVHCKPYYDCDEDKLYISYEQYDACINKKLIVNNTKAVTVHRTEKFTKMGYTFV